MVFLRDEVHACAAMRQCLRSPGSMRAQPCAGLVGHDG